MPSTARVVKEKGAGGSRPEESVKDRHDWDIIQERKPHRLEVRGIHFENLFRGGSRRAR